MLILSVGLNIMNGMYEGEDYGTLGEDEYFDLSAMCITETVWLGIQIIGCVYIMRGGFMLKETFNEWSLLDDLYIMDYKQY